MIRIKVIPLRKVIEKLEWGILFITIVLVMALLILFVMDRKEILIGKMLSLKSGVYIANEESLVSLIVKNKLFLVEAPQMIPIEDVKIPLDTTTNYTETHEMDIIPHWEKPEEFSVQVLENGKVKVGNAIIKNTSKLILDTESLKTPSTYAFSDKTHFLIFHTHTSESYEIPDNLYSDTYRTQNSEYNMLSVGEALKNALTKEGFEAVQNRTVHDYPSYNGSYSASLKTVQQMLQNNHYDFLLDLHRDAISSNPHYRLVTQIQNEDVARLMFVVGSNGSGLSHDNWMENLKRAIIIQNKAEEMYPGLFREISLCNSRYNQQLSPGALIIEVGGTGNTLEEAKKGVEYLAKVLASMKVDLIYE